MTDKGDYRLYLEEKFDGFGKLMNAQFENVHNTLDTIKEQTTKTNSRVTKLEEDKEAIDKILILHKEVCKEGGKVDNLSKQVEQIKEDLDEYRFIKKYPKLAIILIVVFSLGILISSVGAFNTIRNTMVNKEINHKIDSLEVFPYIF